MGTSLDKCLKRNARKHQINLTDKTREILEPLRKVFSSWTEILLDGFSENERDEIFDYLERINTNAQNKLDQIKK